MYVQPNQITSMGTESSFRSTTWLKEVNASSAVKNIADRSGPFPMTDGEGGIIEVFALQIRRRDLAEVHAAS